MSAAPVSEGRGPARREAEAVEAAERAEGLQAVIVAGLEAMGARVRFAPGGGDNLLRRTDGAAAPFEVVVEGLDNLVHELGHVLWLGRLEDDHGVDYGAIPYDLDTPEGRGLLFEELACSVLSCSFMAHVRGEDPAEVGIGPAVAAWFVEQVGIQPVFYGYEAQEGARFMAVVDRLRVAHGEALEARCAELHRRACAWIEGHASRVKGAEGPPAGWVPPRGLGFDLLWRASSPRFAPIC